MKIVKQGMSKAKIEKIKNIVKRFKCRTCECIFEADKDEYSIRQCDYNETEYYCICPNCGDNAFELRMR